MTGSFLGEMELNKERREAEDFLHAFYERYFIERELGQILTMLAEDVVSVGVSAKTSFGRAEFAEWMQKELEAMPGPQPYRVLHTKLRGCGPHSWVSFAELEVRISVDERREALYDMRLTIVLHKEEGAWQIDSLHTSEMPLQRGDGQLLSLQFIEQREKPFPRGRQDALNQIISQLMPGGIISSYIEEGFPLLTANEQLLQMAGYVSYEELHADTAGLLINSIHPEDQQLVIERINTALSCGKQFEVEYRMKRQDGSYIWVHDLGRKTQGEGGRGTIISVRVDISENMDERRKLELETGIDALTGVYNRKGAAKQIAQTMSEGVFWIYCIVDLDNFKKVNDIYGHKQGDRILCYIADQLKGCFSHPGTVYRLGGDEFALFIPEYSDLESIMVQLQQVMEEYAWFLWEECPNTNSTLSIGGVYSSGRQDMELIYEKADRNLYQVKKSGKGKLCLTEWEET